MKILSQYFLVALLLTFVTSCEKEVIPEPNDNASVSTSFALFVSGTFNGIEENKIIDEITYSGHSYIVDSQGILAEWCFDVHDMINDTSGFPELSFRIVNHEQSATWDYQDLVLSTSSSTIEFVDDQSPVETQHGRFTAFYVPNQNDFYVSDMVANAPLNVLEAKDTLVDGVQYRILEVTGDINLINYSTFEQISIDNYHARMAFSL